MPAPTRLSKDEIEKIDFLVKLDFYLGERKIDVIVAKDATRLIEREALEKGVEL